MSFGQQHQHIPRQAATWPSQHLQNEKAAALGQEGHQWFCTSMGRLSIPASTKGKEDNTAVPRNAKQSVVMFLAILTEWPQTQGLWAEEGVSGCSPAHVRMAAATHVAHPLLWERIPAP